MNANDNIDLKQLECKATTCDKRGIISLEIWRLNGVLRFLHSVLWCSRSARIELLMHGDDFEDEGAALPEEPDTPTPFTSKTFYNRNPAGKNQYGATPVRISVAMTTPVTKRQHESETGRESKKVQVSGGRSENVDVEERTRVGLRFMLFIQTPKCTVPRQLAIRDLISTRCKFYVVSTSRAHLRNYQLCFVLNR